LKKAELELEFNELLDKIRDSKTYIYLIPILLIPGIIGFILASDNLLISLLPKTVELEKSLTPGYRQEARDAKLIELINGGAVLFFRHGFSQTVFQEYFIEDSTKYMNFEIYQMNNSQGAKGIFLARTDSTSEKISLGHLGVKGNYFCTFYRGSYYVVATASDSSKTIQEILFRTAKIIDEKIKRLYE
jgi:hypothetical protein